MKIVNLKMRKMSKVVKEKKINKIIKENSIYFRS